MTATLPPQAPPEEPPARKGLVALFITGAALAVVGTLVAVFLILAAPEEEAGFDFVVIVPAGTGARVDAGEELDLMPHDVSLEVGDRLVIDNRDDRVHVVGPITVRPGERAVYGFDEPGRYIGGCTVDDSGETVIVVS
jgi:hypothetical protein